MNEIEKRMNLYKSTIGQIDKLIEDTHCQEARDGLEQAKKSVEQARALDVEMVWKSFEKIVKGIRNFFGWGDD